MYWIGWEIYHKTQHTARLYLDVLHGPNSRRFNSTSNTASAHGQQRTLALFRRHLLFRLLYATVRNIVNYINDSVS